MKKTLTTVLLLLSLSFNAFSKYEYVIILHNLPVDSSNNTTIYTHISWCQGAYFTGMFNDSWYYYGPADSARWFLNGNYVATTLDSQSFAVNVPGIYTATGYKNAFALPSKSINVVYSGSCPSPSGLASANITQTSARVQWTLLPCATGYKVQYRAMGTSSWIIKKNANNNPKKVLTGLNPNTIYEWRVATRCVTNPVTWSPWSSINNFKTKGAFSEVTFQDKTAGELLADREINIYPNPVNDVLNISLNNLLSANTIITISDMQGRMVGEKNTNHTHGSNSKVIPIDVSALSQGVYLLRMDGMVRRFVKL